MERRRVPGGGGGIVPLQPDPTDKGDNILNVEAEQPFQQFKQQDPGRKHFSKIVKTYNFFCYFL